MAGASRPVRKGTIAGAQNEQVNSIYMIATDIPACAVVRPPRITELAAMRGLCMGQALGRVSSEVRRIISNFKVRSGRARITFNSTHGGRKGLADTALGEVRPIPAISPAELGRRGPGCRHPRVDLRHAEGHLDARQVVDARPGFEVGDTRLAHYLGRTAGEGFRRCGWWVHRVRRGTIDRGKATWSRSNGPPVSRR